MLKSIGENAVHMRWSRTLDKEFKRNRGIGERPNHPLCLVPGKREFKTTRRVKDVTCLSCLRNLAKAVCDEVALKEAIIKCWVKARKR